MGLVPAQQPGCRLLSMLHLQAGGGCQCVHTCTAQPPGVTHSSHMLRNCLIVQHVLAKVPVSIIVCLLHLSVYLV